MISKKELLKESLTYIILVYFCIVLTSMITGCGSASQDNSFHSVGVASSNCYASSYVYFHEAMKDDIPYPTEYKLLVQGKEIGTYNSTSPYISIIEGDDIKYLYNLKDTPYHEVSATIARGTMVLTPTIDYNDVPQTDITFKILNPLHEESNAIKTKNEYTAFEFRENLDTHNAEKSRFNNIICEYNYKEVNDITFTDLHNLLHDSGYFYLDSLNALSDRFTRVYAFSGMPVNINIDTSITNNFNSTVVYCTLIDWDYYMEEDMIKKGIQTKELTDVGMPNIKFNLTIIR
jgi:hypothetical protein